MSYCKCIKSLIKSGEPFNPNNSTFGFSYLSKNYKKDETYSCYIRTFSMNSDIIILINHWHVFYKDEFDKYFIHL